MYYLHLNFIQHYIEYLQSLNFEYINKDTSRKRYSEIDATIYFARYQSISNENSAIERLHVKWVCGSVFTFTRRYFFLASTIHHPNVVAFFFRHVATAGSSISVSQRYSPRCRSSELFIEPRTNANRSKPDGIISISRISREFIMCRNRYEIISMGKKCDTQYRTYGARIVICQENTSIFALSFRAFARARVSPYLTLIAIEFWPAKFGKFAKYRISAKFPLMADEHTAELENEFARTVSVALVILLFSCFSIFIFAQVSRKQLHANDNPPHESKEY